MAKEIFTGGVQRPGVATGPVDPIRTRVAKRAVTGGGFGNGRQAGMMIDQLGTSRGGYQGGYQLEAYRSSYANGLDTGSGSYDVPTYFVQMNEQNGGMLYWPTTLREKYQWYRYWARSDAYVGRALELLADLPMSKLMLNMPKMKDKRKRAEILEFYEWQIDRISLFDLLQAILWEYHTIGNVFCFHEWDEKNKMWSRVVMLPPEEVHIFQYPFSESKRVEYKPEKLIKLILDEGNSPGVGDDLKKDILDGIPDDLVKMVRKEGGIVMDTDPSTGSFVYHFARRRSPYLDLGASVLERVLVPMLQKEHYRYTQLSLASRNMTPKNLINAPGLLPDELDDLRTQVDLSYMDPEYSIITNYEMQWELIGAQDRMLDFDREYERIENSVFAGLGVTRELLTGEGSFSGNKITVEILNTMFLLVRETLKDYVEKQLFRPVADAHGWFEVGKNGIKNYHCPKISFNRLTIRDNAEVFDSLYQLYQKGSLPVDIIYDLFNLDTSEIEDKLRADTLTVKDPTFNRMIEDVHSETGRALVERTDVVEQMAKYLKLKVADAPEEEEGGGFGGGSFETGGSFGNFGGENGTRPTIDTMAEDVVSESGLDENSSDEEIHEAVESIDNNGDSNGQP